MELYCKDAANTMAQQDSKQPWSLSKQAGKLDSRYLKMTPPAWITRLPKVLLQTLDI